MSSERIFVTGGTGKTGVSLIQELIKRNAQVTVYARSPEKVVKHPNVTVIQGDITDLASFEKAIVGHTRFFLLVIGVPDTDKIKINLAQKAYDAGVKQIVDLAALRVPWRSHSLVHPHEKSEQAIYDIPNRGYYITLRPTNFMTNTAYRVETVKNQDIIIDAAEPDDLQEWISPEDIAEVAANIFIDPVEKHSDAAYELIGDLITPTRRAEILTKALGRSITYKQLPVQKMYDLYLDQFKSHDIAYYLATSRRSNPVYRGLPILLRREPENYESWVTRNIATFQ
ncbi:hypothetical protein INT45_004283 [Circinella minor]|uniref:NmrA-like domain-containing protein n=1 Tax=Circinella minor TaxID=1195481 RepID=A0A8H7SF64_9FUNG|nr:hypothetical protein INT45_004283 [Circinella minor]